MFADGSAYGVHGLIDYLAQTQPERNAAQNIGVKFAEAPTADQQIDHAAGGRAGGIGEIGSGFHDDPSVGCGIGGDAFRGLDQRS